MSAKVTRRHFIRGAAGLAALAVVGPSLVKLTKTDRERLIEMVKTGVVRDQWFHISEPVVLRSYHGLLITNCYFVMTDRGILDLADSRNVTISYCHFDCRQQQYLESKDWLGAVKS